MKKRHDRHPVAAPGRYRHAHRTTGYSPPTRLLARHRAGSAPHLAAGPIFPRPRRVGGQNIEKVNRAGQREIVDRMELPFRARARLVNFGINPRRDVNEEAHRLDDRAEASPVKVALKARWRRLTFAAVRAAAAGRRRVGAGRKAQTCPSFSDVAILPTISEALGRANGRHAQ